AGALQRGVAGAGHAWAIGPSLIGMPETERVSHLVGHGAVQIAAECGAGEDAAVHLHVAFAGGEERLTVRTGVLSGGGRDAADAERAAKRTSAATERPNAVCGEVAL